MSKFNYKKEMRALFEKVIISYRILGKLNIYDYIYMT